MESILDSVKQVLGQDADYTSFDVDVLMGINSVFSTLNQLGIGPTDGFAITDNTAVWADFLGSDPRLNSVKTYVYLRVRMLFDPPTTSYLITAMEKQILELEWRLNVVYEGMVWAISNPIEDLILDGGGP